MTKSEQPLQHLQAYGRAVFHIRMDPCYGWPPAPGTICIYMVTADPDQGKEKHAAIKPEPAV